MFNHRTVVVLGAGASKEVGLPTGLELKDQLASILNFQYDDWNKLVSGDQLVCSAIKLYVREKEPQTRNIKEYIHAAWRLRDALPQAISIDNLLQAHQGDRRIEICGKLAIVRAILEAEKASYLYIHQSAENQSLDYRNFQDTWYNSFVQLLTEGSDVSQIQNRLLNINIISFNYDRCLVHFLVHAIGNYYGIKRQDAEQIVGNLRIHHPYGVVGRLLGPRTEDSVEFGGTPSVEQILHLASKIRTFAEGTDPQSSDIETIREAVSRARILVFLGFAFHRMNLELLDSSNDVRECDEKTQAFATALGLSESDSRLIQSDISRMVRVSDARIVIRNDLTCAQLFREYWRSFSLS